MPDWPTAEVKLRARPQVGVAGIYPRSTDYWTCPMSDDLCCVCCNLGEYWLDEETCSNGHRFCSICVGRDHHDDDFCVACNPDEAPDA